MVLAKISGLENLWEKSVVDRQNDYLAGKTDFILASGIMLLSGDKRRDVAQEILDQAKDAKESVIFIDFLNRLSTPDLEGAELWSTQNLDSVLSLLLEREERPAVVFFDGIDHFTAPDVDQGLILKVQFLNKVVANFIRNFPTTLFVFLPTKKGTPKLGLGVAHFANWALNCSEDGVEVIKNRTGKTSEHLIPYN